MNLLSGLLCIL